MVVLINGLPAGLEVPLRTFRCKARGGGGRLRQATAREEKEEEKKIREDINI